ncbi:MAG: STAS domain-containing protein [Fibrobacterota bacterium]
MICNKHKLGKYLVVQISDDFMVLADLQELDIFIDGLITQKNFFIALRFEQISYIYSGALSILVKNVKKIKNSKGDICLLEPNRDVNDVIKIANLDSIIAIYNSEEELLAHQQCPEKVA